MILVKNLKLPLDTDFDFLQQAVEKKLGIKVRSVRLYKKSVDARKKDNILFNCAVLLTVDNDEAALKRLKKLDAEAFNEKRYVFKTVSGQCSRPVVVGFGPAGMFAALSFAKAGLKPIVLERGKSVDERIADVEHFFKTNELNPESNIQFGEGGAGTFSDGKLNTGIKDSRIRTVLEIFNQHGAKENILYDAKPHIGTDILVEVIKSIRQEIISLGGEVLFQHKLTKIFEKNGAVQTIEVETPNGTVKFNCDNLVLAIGHSARDTFVELQKMGVSLEPKAFAVGARIEHSQAMINRAQYGSFANHPNLGAADYKLAVQTKSGRGVFTFCMCPGGEVVNASSEQGMVAVNGMSYNARNGENANSAVLCSVSVEDFYKGDALDGMYFQREIEEKAFKVGQGLPVAMGVGEFLQNGSSDLSVAPTVKTGVTHSDINDVLPKFVCDSLKEALPLLDRKLNGFGNPSAVLIAPETRSSSPVRILRDKNGVSSLLGLYPCGEGAGYAGGITSAAVDGLRIAEKIIEALS